MCSSALGGRSRATRICTTTCSTSTRFPAWPRPCAWITSSPATTASSASIRTASYRRFPGSIGRGRTIARAWARHSRRSEGERVSAVVNSDLARFSKEIAALNMKPLWERVMRLKPGTAAQAAIWRWKDTRPLLARACELITARQAERRGELLEELSKDGEPHPSHGWRLRYTDPVTCRDPFPSMAAFMQQLPKGFAGTNRRSTDGTVYCVVEGNGSVDIGATHLEFAPHDVFVVPSWEPYRLAAGTDFVLFSYSDRAPQEALGFWREET